MCASDLYNLKKQQLFCEIMQNLNEYDNKCQNKKKLVRSDVLKIFSEEYFTPAD